ncbi:MAG: P63C domain-containing protein [Phycisphaerae bacterium]|nr:P63C domain-containing protein [Phycisphaerae bacterium]
MEQENPAKKVLCGSFERPLVIGEIKIPCFVLEDESRIITLEGMKSALGIGAAAGPSARLAEFISAIQLNSAAAVAVAAKLRNPIRFRADGGTKVELAYQSSLLVDLCESILDARLQGQLTDRFLPLATRAELLVRGYARVGLDALIDEATGFQKFRSRTALIELLQKYISDRLLEWTKTFPDEFYTEMFRLKGWDFANLKAGDRKPSIVGRYTRNIVYERMAVPVIHQLEKLNPSGGTGTRKSKHHQFLTREIGHPELKSHIDKVTMLMQLSESWEDFRSKLRKVMPKRWEQFQFNDLLPDPPDAPPTYSDDGLD